MTIFIESANIEVQANRIDPDRWQDFNTNLAIWTLIAPRFLMLEEHWKHLD